MEEESFVGIYKKGAEKWETYRCKRTNPATPRGVRQSKVATGPKAVRLKADMAKSILRAVGDASPYIGFY